MPTLKKFVAESHISEKLVRAVVRQIGGWESFTSHAEDVNDYGAAGGFTGFTYYADTVPFAWRYRDVIMNLAKGLSDDIGESVFKMLAGFVAFSWQYTEGEIAEAIYNRKSENRDTILNALAWFALEEVCRSYANIFVE